MKKIAIALILLQLMGCSVVTAVIGGAVGGATVWACKEFCKFFGEQK
jgi:hypothetical protein